MSNITLNIVEPGGPAVPDTGLFTHGIGGPEAAILAVSTVLVLALVAAIVWYFHKKHSKATKAFGSQSLLKSSLTFIKNKKHVRVGLAALAVLVSAGTFASLLIGAGKGNTNAIDAEDGLTVTVLDTDYTIELADEPVFAVLPVEITVAEATEAGYTLTAYADSTDLVSTTDDSKVIPMIVADEGELTSLTDNTYGLSLVEPTTKDDPVYDPLSTDPDNPTSLQAKGGYVPTPANDTTTIYYGFYITPDTPYGTYTSGEVEYEAEENAVAVTFDGNGNFYFDGDESQTTNMMKYVPNVVLSETAAYSHTPNVDDNGTQEGMYPLSSGQTFVYKFNNAEKVYVDFVKMGGDGCGPGPNGYFTFWSGSHPGYTAADYETTNPELDFGNTTGKYDFSNYASQSNLVADIDNGSVTIAYATGSTKNSYCGNANHGYGYYAVVTAEDADGNDANLIGNNPIGGEYLTPEANAKVRFLGWSTNPNDTKAMYYSLDDVMLGLDLTGGDVTLYAISEPAFVISYNGNGADNATAMNNAGQYTTNLESNAQQVDLLASNFQREGYGFVGWSTDNEAWAHLTNESTSDDPIIYGPNQTITVDPTASTKLNLYAIWADVATDKDGEELTFQTENLLTTPLSDDANDTLAAKDNGYVTALKDERDGEVYAVAKLADGNYWMIENLRLDNSATISTTNTNNPLVVDNAVAIKNNDGNTYNHLSATSSSWCTNSDAECYDQSNLNTVNTVDTVGDIFSKYNFANSAHEDLAVSVYSYSNYYNWYSATAGQGTHDDGSNVTVEGDLCPAGWQLPYGGNGDGSEGQSKGNTSGGFYYLNQQMGGDTSSTGSNNWRSFPNNFVYSGYWYGSSAGGRGNFGYYWSSTASYSDYAYFLYFYSGYVYPGTDSYGKYVGYSVRCVAPVE